MLDPGHEFNSSFPPVYFIWTRGLEDRKKALLAEAQEKGIGAIPFEGIYGETAGISASYKKKHKGQINKNRTALCVNMWFLWQHALSTGAEWVIICEDDVIFPDYFYGLVRDILNEARENNINLVYLGWLEKYKRNLTQITPRMAKMLGGFPYGAHCMLIRRDALKILIDTNLEINDHIDISIGMNSLPSLNWAVCYPTIIGQKSQSGIWKSSLIY